MSLLRVRLCSRIPVLWLIAILLIPCFSSAEEFKVFTSDEYGFTMKYPASWVKIDKPQGNYYVVFQAPELIDNFRSRIHVAAHSPVKDSLEVFKQELRSGITELQGKPSSGKEKQNVQILDEGDFKSEVPGAYYFFIQAYEEKLKIWMDIVIVFLKNEQTLLRISCLAPSQSMENFYQIFNNVLVSVKFVAGGGTPGQTSTPQLGPAQTPAPSQPQVQPAPPATVSPQPQRQVTPPATVTPLIQRQPGPPSTAPVPLQPPSTPQSMRPEPQPSPGMAPSQVQSSPTTGQGQPSPPPPRTAPRGPLKAPEGPATGIVN